MLPPTTLGLGDNSYQSTGTCWYNIVKPLDGDADANNPKRLKITIGNHDDTPSSLLNSYKKHFLRAREVNPSHKLINHCSTSSKLI